MAVVEDELLSDSDDGAVNIKVVIEDDDSWDEDDSDDEETVNTKIESLEISIKEYMYSYDNHAELLKLLSNNLDKYREAFKRLQTTLVVRPEEWEERLQIECKLALPQHEPSCSYIFQLFEEACVDCYHMPILLEWLTFVETLKAYIPLEQTRSYLKDLIKRVGADPLSGKVFWYTAYEIEKEAFESLTESSDEYTQQGERVLYYLEEIVSRPLVDNTACWEEFENMALRFKDKEYVERVRKQHEIAKEFLLIMESFEHRFLNMEMDDKETKLEIYKEYIDKVISVQKEETKFEECDIDNILKTLYDRVTTECLRVDTTMDDMFKAFVKLGRQRFSHASQQHIVDIFVRRRPTTADGWIAKMQLWEEMAKSPDEMRTLIETALNQNLEMYKDAENLWMEYLSYIRRHVDHNNTSDVEKMRKHFRTAWESITFTWEDEASDCCIPLYWARLEYKVFGNPKQGKELFEEMFNYGTNKTLSKYWESLLSLETAHGSLSKNKLRDLYRRAVKFIEDYPRTICNQWLDYERDFGTLTQMQIAADVCEEKMAEWRKNFDAQRRNLQGQKGNQKDRKGKAKKKNQLKKNQPKKRKFEGDDKKNNKKKKDDETKTKKIEMKEVEIKDDKKGQKRAHDGDINGEEVSTKRAKSEEPQTSTEPSTRENCTLFVSNLEFKVDEEKLREKLAEFGDIVSLRIREGVKAFGGSICYCQYKSVASVEKALDNDRMPLDGRPMFFSKYNEKKTKTFKYSTGAEKNKLFVRNLPYTACNKETLTKLFEKYGELKDVRIVTFKDGKPKGLAYVEFTNEEDAKGALACDGHVMEERPLKVELSNPPAKDASASISTALGAPKREHKGGMHRTQLSNLIPTVVQRANAASTSGASQKPSTSGKKLTNSDFRNMLLK